MRGTHGWQVNSPHKGPVTRKMFVSDDVILKFLCCMQYRIKMTVNVVISQDVNYQFCNDQYNCFIDSIKAQNSVHNSTIILKVLILIRMSGFNLRHLRFIWDLFRWSPIGQLIRLCPVQLSQQSSCLELGRQIYQLFGSKLPTRYFW